MLSGHADVSMQGIKLCSTGCECFLSRLIFNTSFHSSIQNVSHFRFGTRIEELRWPYYSAVTFEFFVHHSMHFIKESKNATW
jgi:hypothetical protein